MDTELASTGRPLPPDWALQDPADYLDVLRTAVPAAIDVAGVSAGQVIGIGTDFTACTVLPALADGTPLCELPALTGRPHAYAKLWKHHAAQPHAPAPTAPPPPPPPPPPHPPPPPPPPGGGGGGAPFGGERSRPSGSSP